MNINYKVNISVPRSIREGRKEADSNVHSSNATSAEIVLPPPTFPIISSLILDVLYL